MKNGFDMVNISGLKIVANFKKAVSPAHSPLVSKK
jgi:hypothetical protein